MIETHNTLDVKGWSWGRRKKKVLSIPSTAPCLTLTHKNNSEACPHYFSSLNVGEKMTGRPKKALNGSNC